jgi:transcriptional regulator with XRE-family HTH domain
MHDLDTRTAVFELNEKGQGIRAIARALKISRNAVRKILRSRQKEVPSLERAQKAEPHLERIRELYAECEGNLVRVQEKLTDEKVELSYPTLTRFCRLHGIGVKEKTLFAQCYPTFNRFYCKVFLTAAIRFFAGTCGRCMVDNTSVVIAHGTGKNAVAAPEMAAFSDRFGFDFEAHEKGDANRSARVERPFHYIEHNFYPGRSFEALRDLNAQFVDWCRQSNGRHRRQLQAAPVELYQAERPHLKPLPLHIPEVYALHHRVVDLCGYVHVHTNRYSVPPDLIGRTVEVRESIDRIRVFRGHEQMVTHERLEEGKRQRVSLPEHRYPGRWKQRDQNPPPLPEEKVLRAAAPELGALVDVIKRHRGGRAVKPLRDLHRLYLDYPTEPLCAALRVALEYGLYEVKRIEQMVLKNIAGDFFRLPAPPDKEEDDE